MRQPPLCIQMPPNIGERNQAGVPLQREQPILDPGIFRNIRLAAQPDVYAVAAVIQNGQENERPLDENAKRDRLQSLGSLVVLACADQRGAVRPKMFREKRSNRNYAGQRMKLAEEITRVRPGCRSGHALSAAFLPIRRLESRQIQYRELSSVMQVGHLRSDHTLGEPFAQVDAVAQVLGAAVG